MPRCGASADVSPSLLSLFAFKPRQVILAEHQQRSSTTMVKNLSLLKPEQESILTYSVALWLENKGFSKVLKRFLSAAQIEDDNWKAGALNLNEIFSKYQETCKDVREGLIPNKKLEEQVVGLAEKNGVVNSMAHEEIETKKKKKKNKAEVALTDKGITSEDMVVDVELKEPYVNGQEVQSEKVFEFTADQSDKPQKDKKKKKSKSSLEDKKKKKKDDLLSKNKVVAEKDAKGIESAGNQVEEKMRKKIATTSSELPASGTELNSKSKKRSAEAAEDGANESKHTSKKRKTMALDENENQPGIDVAIQESKPKKTKGLEEGKDVQTQNEEENCKNNPSNGVDKSSNSRFGRKQNGTSAEPKTVKAFQRVKIDEVKFADERLQDNSYWAKDGADIGYGAKAQEVLGQVKGRDFRHEKTKKKRGSYRGGQIDLQSHSIKFDNSDDE